VDLAPLAHNHRETSKAGGSGPISHAVKQATQWPAQASAVQYVVTTNLGSARRYRRGPLDWDSHKTVGLQRSIYHRTKGMMMDWRHLACRCRDHHKLHCRAQLPFRSEHFAWDSGTIPSGDKSTMHLKACLSCLKVAQQSSRSESQGQRCQWKSTKVVDERFPFRACHE
jgi:hypothetical protein